MSARALDQFHDLSWLRRTPESLLREYQIAVDGHFEDAARRGHQPDFGIGYLMLQLSRQTGGSRLVVSDDTVLDDHAHGPSPVSWGVRAVES